MTTCWDDIQLCHYLCLGILVPSVEMLLLGLTQVNMCLLPRLVSQLAQKEADHAEAMSALQTKQNMEVKTLKEVLGASETANTDLQKEVHVHVHVYCTCPASYHIPLCPTLVNITF